jgi:hypothetical protein
MRLRRLIQSLATAFTVAAIQFSPAADDLTPLSEEFDSATAFANFQRLYVTEGWPADQLANVSVESAEGRLVMSPHPSSWYQDYKAALAFKALTGNFVATVDVQVHNAAGNGVTSNTYSFGGLLVRAPRPGVTAPNNWQAGQEDWIVQAVGTAGTPGSADYEFKSTDDSVTQPNFPPGSDRAVVQIARIGNVFVLLSQPNGGAWSVVARYSRPDMPATLQVGLTAYANFSVASSVTPLQHNQTILSGTSDFVARFDYYRVARPVIPANLQGLDFTNPGQVSDTQLLAFLGSNANETPAVATAPIITAQPQAQNINAGENVAFNVSANGNPVPTYQWRRDGVNIPGATLNVAGPPPPAADDIAHLTDEFTDPATLANWQRVYSAEGWGFDQLEQWDINQSNSGRMTMMPYSSSWYQEWRGVHAYKQVSGDFVATTDVEPTDRAGTGVPSVAYSLSGIMVRTPRSDIQSGRTDWTPNGENYLFLSMGTASQPGVRQFEVKNTQNSNSQLEISSGGARARIQIARIGNAFLVLRQIDGGAWEVHRRYTRNDMPATLNVGLTTYTDWNVCRDAGYEYHNTNLLNGTVPLLAGGTAQTQPDLIARFDYFRYHRPQVPANLAGRNLANPAEVSDAELLAFLADNANVPGSSTNPPSIAPSITAQPVGQTVNAGASVALNVTAGGTAPLSYQWSRNGTRILGGTQSTLSLASLMRANSGSYTVTISNPAGSVTSQPVLIRVLVPQRIQHPARQPNGQFRLMFGDHDSGPLTAANAQNFEIWGITDLRTGNWIQINAPISTAGNSLYIDDEQSIDQPQRFYRVIER